MTSIIKVRDMRVGEKYETPAGIVAEIIHVSDKYVQYHCLCTPTGELIPVDKRKLLLLPTDTELPLTLLGKKNKPRLAQGPSKRRLISQALEEGKNVEETVKLLLNVFPSVDRKKLTRYVDKERCLLRKGGKK